VPCMDYDTVGAEHQEGLMKGVRFVVDEAGQKTDVIINLKANPELWEDIYDRSLARKRATEPRESLASVKRRLAARGGRRAHG
jgi:hypothetical protein